MRLFASLLTAGSLATGLLSATASATQISSFNPPGNYTPHQWFVYSQQGNATVSIDPAAPAGDPVGPGAGKITTTSDNNDKAEVAVAGPYGTAGTIINNPTFSLSYSYYKQDTGSSNAAAAPSIKLRFDNASTGGKVTLIYEPYYNNGLGSVPTNTWFTDTITADSGLFESNGGFGSTNGFGGPPLKTLRQWLATLTPDFTLANLSAVIIGEGSYNPSQVGYFDNVRISGTGADDNYDFEPAAMAAVPEPSTVLAGVLGGLFTLGYARRRRRRAATPDQTV